MGIHWEQGKKTRTPCPHPQLKKKEKNWINHEGMLSLRIACMKFLFQNCLFGHFWPGLMAGAENWGQSGNLMGTHWERDENMLGTKGK
jgi:hypothetical protein